MGAHPFHAGHMALYNSAKAAFPDSDVYIAATNDTSARPFPFAVKQKLAKLSGVPENRFIPVKSPFRADEITQSYNPADTQLIFVRSEKDATKPPQPGGVKRDGNPAYLQPISDQMAPMTQHAYMAYLPTVEFGPGMTSATQIRTAWPELNERQRTALVMSLYPNTQKNPKLANTVVQMLDTAMGGEAQGVAESSDHTAEAYRAHLIKTLPQIMKLFANVGKGWIPSREQMLSAVDTAYRVMKHTGDVKQAGKALMDELNTLYRMKQGGKGVDEEVTRQMSQGGMRASYQSKYNQPIAEDYLDEARL
jgi:hypothetical protein